MPDPRARLPDPPARGRVPSRAASAPPSGPPPPPGLRRMDLLAQAAAGFDTVDADPALRQQAVRFLRQWLTEPEFAPYRPQVEWLIGQQQWAGLLDRFHQILPFG